MNKINLEVYLFFKGECRQAMEFYKSVFGGKVNYTTYGDTPMAGMDGDKDWIMHAALEGGDIKLMGSDTDGASPETKKVSLSLGGTNEPKMRKIFEALSAGGQVRQPLEKAPWGDTFGSLADKYGVDWMMNIGQAAK